MSKISIIIVNYNGRVWLPNCFESLKRQSYKNFEIIFVDNNSSDDSIEFVRSHYPDTIIVKNSQNSGFAGGNNIGLRYANGEYILLLNTDTRATKTFLENLLDAFEKIPHLGCVQPKIFFMHEPNKLDSCGSYFTKTGFLKHIGNQQRANLPQYNKSFPVLSVKGACMMFKKELLKKTDGLFDNDFWCYFEETDFCLRVWMAGYKCWYYPKSAVYHAMGGTTGWFIKDSFVLYHSFKNKLTSYLKNLSVVTLLKVMPTYLLINIAVGIFNLLVGRFRNSLSIFRALFYNFYHLPTILKKRRIVQKRVRQVQDKQFLKKVTTKFGLTFKNICAQLRWMARYGKNKLKPCVQ